MLMTMIPHCFRSQENKIDLYINIGVAFYITGAGILMKEVFFYFNVILEIL